MPLGEPGSARRVSMAMPFNENGGNANDGSAGHNSVGHTKAGVCEADFRLGAVLVRPAAGEVVVDGDVRHVDYKPMQVLLCLVRHGGAPVSKDVLFAEVWEGAAVGDDVLTVAISSLRRALGDRARAPRFIQTVPRHGYRLLVPVTTERRLAMPRWASWALAASLLVTLLATAWLVRDSVPESAVGRAPTVNALAVMPLANLTGRADEDHVAAGMTEALIGHLAGDPSLRVIAHSSVRSIARDRGARGPDARTVAGELGVDAWVEGSVRRSDDTLRVTVELVDAEAGDHLWARSFDAPLADALRLEEQVARALLVRLDRAPAEDPPAPMIDPQGYEAYLQGRYLLHRGGQQDLEAAIERFAAAAREAPNLAVAYLGSAEAHLMLAREGVDPPRHFASARSASERALEIDARLARAQAVRGSVRYLHDWDFVGASRAFERAEALDGNDPVVLDLRARFLVVVGRFGEALSAVERLRAVDPRAYSRPQVAAVLNLARRHDAALAELAAQIAIEPRAPAIHLELALTHLRRNDLDAAFASYAAFRRLLGDDEATLAAIETLFRRDGPTGVYRQLLDQLTTASPSSVSELARAQLAAGAGELEVALVALERAVDRREPGVVTLATDLAFDPLRDRPRFVALLDRIGLGGVDPRRPEAASRAPGAAS